VSSSAPLGAKPERSLRELGLHSGDALGRELGSALRWEHWVRHLTHWFSARRSTRCRRSNAGSGTRRHLGEELGLHQGDALGSELGRELGSALSDAPGSVLGEALGVELGAPLGVN
jgi:hypothetical protein